MVTITNIKYNVIGIDTFHFDGILEEEVPKGNLLKREASRYWLGRKPPIKDDLII